MNVLRFTVPGEPCGKARARTFMRKRGDGTPFMTTTTPEKTRKYETKVKAACAAAVKAAGWSASKADRFSMSVVVYRSKEGVGSDLDNVVKTIGDSVQGPGLAMPDDRYIRQITACLFHDPENPRVEVSIALVVREAA